MVRIKQIKKTQDDDEIEIGDQVKHPKFGTGTVLYKTGTGERAKAIVVFPEEGQKKLLLKYAKMKKLKEAKPAEEAVGPVSEAEIVAALDDSVAAPLIKKEKKRRVRAAMPKKFEEKEEGEEEEEEMEVGVVRESEDVEEAEEEEEDEEAADEAADDVDGAGGATYENE
jgi:hypothetical protein